MLFLPFDQELFRKAGQREPLGSLSPISCNMQEMFSLEVFEASPQLDPNSLNCKAPSQASITNWTCSERPKVPSVAWHREKAAGTEDIAASSGFCTAAESNLQSWFRDLGKVNTGFCGTVSFLSANSAYIGECFCVHFHTKYLMLKMLNSVVVKPKCVSSVFGCNVQKLMGTIKYECQED